MRLPSITTLYEYGFDGGEFSLKYETTITGSDDCIYGIPSGARRVVKFNPKDKSLKEIGPDLGDGADKWYGGVLANNGKIYCAPYMSSEFLKIDIVTGAVTTISINLSERGMWKWASGAKHPDGCIYYMPMGARHILKFDPETETVVYIGKDLGGGFKYRGTVVGIDRCVYGIPYQCNRLVRFNPMTKGVSTVGKEADERFLCGNGASGRDGCIYAVSDDGKVLRIDVMNGTYSFVGNKVPSNHRMTGWVSPILGIDGCFYWPPCAANRTLKFDPETQVASLVGRNLSTMRRKWGSGALAKHDGFIYCMPSNAFQVLVIDQFTEFATELEDNMKLYPEELGRLFAKDKYCMTFYESSVKKFGKKRVLRLIEDCMPVDVECPELNLQAFMLVASYDVCPLSVIYYLLRNNVESFPLANYDAGNLKSSETKENENEEDVVAKRVNDLSII